jgi:hypothetical protein
VVHAVEGNTRFVEAVLNRLAWKARPVFHTAKAFFFGGGDQAAIYDERGSRVTVIGV